MALLEIEQGPITGSEVSSEGFQPSLPLSLERLQASPITEYAKAVVDHAGVALYWTLSNHLISAKLINLYAEMRGIPSDALTYQRAEGVLTVFGPWGLKALIDHFAPEVDIKELKRRGAIAEVKRPPSEMKTFDDIRSLLEQIKDRVEFQANESQIQTGIQRQLARNAGKDPSRIF